MFWLRSLLLSLVVLAGCNGLSLRKTDGSLVGESVRSALHLQTPGPVAQTYLGQHGLAPSFGFDPVATAAKLSGDASPEGRLVLAELCDLAGREAEFWSPSRALNHYLDAAWYASLALFDESEELPLDCRGEALTIYNHAVERFLRRSAGRKLLPDDQWEKQLTESSVRISVRRDDAVWTPDPFDELKFARDYVAIGVPDRQREGVGVPLIAVRKRWWRDPERQAAPEKFFQPLQAYPVTAILRFQPTGANGRPDALLELHDPLRYDGVQLAGRNVLLAADTTIPLVYQVTNSDLDRITQIGLLDPQREEHKTGLYLTHPYERGKIPVVLIHGLWSSPKTWTRTINDLRADPAIRERYQFWTFQYPTGNPFIHSAAKLRQALTELRHYYDPDGSDPAFDQMVLVGHSMGGLIAKTMIASSGDNVWRLISPRPFDELKAPDEDKEIFRQTFFFEPVPSAKRVVFIAVPHRGSLLGNNWLGQIADRVIRRPNVFVKAHDVLLQQNGDDFFTNGFVQGIPSSVRTLKLHSPLLQTVDHLELEPNVPRHSIIARVAPVPLPMSTDGVVPYDSAHEDNVVSEKIVLGTHTCLDQSDVIEEIRRILYQHVEEQQLPRLPIDRRISRP